MKRLFVILLLFSTGSVAAQDYQLHSIYMYSFMRYVQWPDSGTSEPFTIAVVGESEIVPSLLKLAQTKKLGKRDILVKQFANAEEMGSCDILFLSKQASPEFEEVLIKVGNKSTLIVTEEEGKGAMGSNINFIYKEGKLAFELNRSAMEKRNLKVATELARLAILI